MKSSIKHLAAILFHPATSIRNSTFQSILALSVALLAASASNAAVINVPGDQATIQAAVTAAAPGDTIQIAAGTLVLSSSVNINKANLIVQGAATLQTTLQASHTIGTPAISITASGVTIRDLKIEKTTKNGPQSLILVQAANATIEDCEIFGQYVFGDGDVSRAIEVAYGTSGLVIQNNTIYGLRLPGYFNGSLATPTTGTIANNLVYGTRGWVVDGANLTFSGNSWGSGNALDIAILSGTPAAYYPNLATISSANSQAAIEDQRPGADPNSILTTVFVDAAYAGVYGTANGTALRPFTTITPAIARVTAGGFVKVAAGTYAENLTIGKSLDIRGPNYGISPNGGVRAAEAVIVPASTNTAGGYVVTITTSGVSINGFTIDGDNTALANSGVGLGGIYGTSMDAARGVSVATNNVNNTQVAKNIIKNFAEAGVRFQQATNYFATTVGATFSSGNVIDDNLISESLVFGVNIRNSMYTAITSNVISNVSYGVYLRDLRIANQGGPAYQAISGNTITSREMGVWFNLCHGAPYAVSNNTINAFGDASITKWYGIMLSTVSAAQNATNQLNLPLVATKVNWSMTNNSINGAGLNGATTGIGYWLWYVDNNRDDVSVDHYGTITGGSVSNIDLGLYMHNVDNDPNTAFLQGRTGAHASISGVSFTVKAGGTGIYLKDDPTWLTSNIAPLVAKRDVKLTMGAGVSLSGGAKGLVIEQPFAAISAIGDMAFSGQSTSYIELNANTSDLDATTASFDGDTGATATQAENFAIEDKILHKPDDLSLGLVRVKVSNIFVATGGSVGQGITAASDGDTVNVDNGALLVLTTAITKSVTFSGTFAITSSNIPTDGSATAVLSSFMSRKGSSTVSANMLGMNANQIAAVIANQALFTTIIYPPVQVVSGVTPTGYFTTIQAAINFATVGDIINAAAGTYAENLVLTKQLTLKGAQFGVDARGRVVGSPNPAVETVVAPATGMALDLQTNSNASVVDGFAFVGSHSGTSGTVGNTSGTNTGLQFKNNHVSVAAGFTTTPLYMNKSAVDSTFDKNEFVAATGSSQSVFFDGPDAFHGLYFTNNNVLRSSGVSGTGFFVDGNHNVSNTGGATRTPLIKGNTITGFATGANLGSRSFDYGEISENTFTGNSTNGLQGGPQHTQILRNTFNSNGNGIAFTSFGNLAVDRGAQLNTVSNNFFLNNATTDIFLSASQGAGLISSNTISGNSFASSVGVTYGGAETINASSNWWNNTTGPTVASHPTGTGAQISGAGSANVDYTPLVLSGTDTNLVSAGFQGDFSSLRVVATGPQSGAASRIQEGIDMAATGGTIAVSAGTYPNNVNATAKSVTLAAGSSPGQVIINGDFTLDSDDTLPIEINGATTPGTDYDQWVVNGNVSLGNALVTFSGTHTPAYGDSFTIIDNDGVDPIPDTFSGLAENAIITPFLGYTNAAIVHYAAGSGNDFVIESMPDIKVEQPLASDIPDGGSKSFGTVPVGGATNLTFTIKNVGAPNLTGLGITIDGLDASMFSVIASPVAPVSGPSGSTTFTVQFAPTSAVVAAAALHIASNDPDEAPFDINLSGTGVAIGTANFVNNLGSVTAVLSGVNVTVNATASTYTLVRSSGTWIGVDDGVLGPVVSGNGLNTLTILKSAVTQVLIGDGAAAGNVIMAGSATETFGHPFTVDLNLGATAGTLAFSGNCAFTGSAGFTGSTTRTTGGITVNTAVLVSAAGSGAISLSAPSNAITLTGTGSVATTSGNLTLSGASIGTGTSSAVTSTTGNVALTATGAISTGTSSQVRSTAGGTVSLVAGGAITTGGSSFVTSTTNSLTITAGTTFTSGTSSTVSSTTGNLAVTTTNGALTSGATSSITTTSGNLTLTSTNSSIATGGTNSIVSTAEGDLELNAKTSLSTGSPSTVSVTGAGTLELLAQTTLSIGTGATVSASGNNVILTAGTGALHTLTTGQNSTLSSGGTITAQAGGAVTIGSNTDTSLLDAIVTTTGGGLISLTSTAANIVVNPFAKLTTSGGITLDAVTSIGTSTSSQIKSTGAGAVNLTAITSIGTGTSSEVTSAGGNLTITAGTTFQPGATSILATTGSGIMSVTSAGTWNTSNVAFTATTDTGSLTLKSNGSSLQAGASTITTQGGNLELNGFTSVSTGTSAQVKVNVGLGTLKILGVSSLSIGTGSTTSTNGGAMELKATGPTGTWTANANSIITSNGGDITTLAGGAWLATTNTTINAAGGSVSASTAGTITLGANTDTVANFAEILTSGTGTITLTSTGLSITANSFSQITSVDGALALNAVTNIATGGSTEIKSTGTGPVTLDATTSVAMGTSSKIKSGSGNVTITADTTFAPGTGSEISTTGAGILSVTSILTFNTGNLTFTATTGTGDLTLKSTTASFTLGASTVTTGGGDIELQGTSVSTGTSSLVEVLSGIGNITLTSASTTITTGSSSTLRTVDGTITVAAAPILTTGAITMGASSLATATGAGSISLGAQGTITTTAGTVGTPTRLSTLGTGGITVATYRDLVINNESSITVVNGNVLLSANQQVNPTAGSFSGITTSGLVSSSGSGIIQIVGRGGDGGSNNRGVILTGGANNRGKVLSNGTGTVTINGTNGASVSGAGNCYGIHLNGSTAEVASNTGDISLNGTSSATGTGGSHNGIYMDAGAKVNANGATVDVVLTGLSGTGGATSNNAGIWLTGANTQVKAAAGSLTLNGTSRSVGTGTANIGVRVEAGAQVLSTATNVVPIIIAGTGANSTRTVDGNSSNYGVYLTGASTKVSTAKGSIGITGQAGNFTGGPPALADNNVGIYVLTDVEISSTDDANITLTGIAGTGGDDNGIGVFLNDTSATTMCRVSSLNGNITVNGTSGGTDAASLNTDGVRLDNVGVEIVSTGTGNVIINGIRPVAATTGFAFNALGASRVIHTAGTGDVAINADSISLSTTCVVDATGNDVTLKPYTAGRAINLGAADNGHLGLTDAELDRVTAANLNIGAASSGTITVSAAQTRPASTSVTLTTGANIDLSAGTLNTGGGTLALNAPTGTLQPTVAGTDATSLTTTLGSGTDLSIVINGTTIETQYKPLNVSGNLTIAGSVDLVLSGSYVPVIGNTFTLLNVGGANPVTGTFTGKTEGYTFLNFLGSNKSAVLSYVGGGNDVTLTITAQPEIAVHDGGLITDPEILDAQGAPINFGSTTTGPAVPVTRTFTIRNSGSDPLTVTSITAPTGFSVLGAPGSVPANNGVIDGTATFQVQLDATSAGYFGGNVTINNNDPSPAPGDENPFTFQVLGTVEPVGPATMVTGSGGTVNVGLASIGGNALTITVNVPVVTGIAPANVPHYTLVRSGTGAGAWTVDPLLAPGVTAVGATLTIQKTAVTNVNILDAEGGTGLVNVIFAGQGAVDLAPGVQEFDDSFNVVLDATNAGGTASSVGTVTFSGFCEFSGTNSLTVSTDRNIILNRSRTVSVVDGDLTFLANRRGYTPAVIPTFDAIAIVGDLKTSGKGKVLVSGHGSSAINVSSWWGVTLWDTIQSGTGGSITSSSTADDAGTITILGTGSSSGGNSSSNYGIVMGGTTAKVESARSAIVLTGDSPSTGDGTGANGSPHGHFGVYLFGGAKVKATNTANPTNITITGDSGPASLASPSNYGVYLTGAGTEVTCANGTIAIDGESRAATTGSSNMGVRIEAGAKVSATGADPVQVSIVGTNAVTTGTSGSNYAVLLSGANTEVVSSNRNITINGTSSSTGSGASNMGLRIESGAKVRTTGTDPANITLTGISGASTGTSATNYGVSLVSTNTEVSTTNGDIVINGTSNAISTGNSNQGVRIETGAKVLSTGTTAATAITITGNSAPATGTSSSNYGVNLVGAGVDVASAKGTIGITGVSNATTGTGTSNQGVRVEAGAKVRSTGSEPVAISLHGTGADSTVATNTAVSNYGAYITGLGSQVTTAKGSISIVGLGGDLLTALSLADNQYGVVIESDAVISSTDNAPITITGTAGVGGDDNMAGVIIADSSATNLCKISNVAGDITITGTSGGVAGVNPVGCDGVRLDSVGVEVSTSGSGNINITGTKSVAATGGNAFAAIGAAAVKSTSTGYAVIGADTMALSTTCVFNMGTSSVTFKPTTGGRLVEIGGTTASAADTAGTVLGLIDAETDRVTAGTCVVGSTGAGTITVRGPVTTASNVNLSLISGTNIVQNDTSGAGGTAATTGTITTAGTGSVKFTTVAGSLQPIPDALGTGGVLPDVTAPGGVTFGAGTKLAISMNASPTASVPPSVGDSEAATNGYRRLTVTGSIDLTGADLVISGTFVPTAPVAGPFPVVTATSLITTSFNSNVVGHINGSNYGALVSYNVAGNNAVLAVVADPELAVYNGPDNTNPVLLDAQVTPVDFGTPVYLQTVSKTFTLENTGTADLNVSGITVPAGYTLETPFTGIITPGNSATFQVRFDAATVATVTGDVTINSNDADEAVFTFPVTGTVQTFAANYPAAGTVRVVADAAGGPGRNITVKVPPASPLIGGIAGNLVYQLVLSSGTWGGTDVLGVVTGNGTNTLTIPKSGVSIVDIIDAAGANTVAFEGRAATTDITGAGRTFDDHFQVVLDHPSAGAITFTGNCVFTTDKSLNASTVKNINQNANTTLSVVDGGITLTSGFGPLPITGNLDAVSIFGLVTTAGKGNIWLKGKGSDSTQCWGVTLGGVGGSSGKVTSIGTGALSDPSAEGTITLEGVGGPNIGGGALGYGVYLNGATVEVSSAKGAINVIGTSPAMGTGGTHVGIVMAGGAKITGTDAAITLTGTGAAAPANSNHGVWLTGTNTKVVAQNGSITINGTAGGDGNAARDNERGVLIETNAQVCSTGTGATAATISVTGIGGAGDDDHAGVTVRGSGANINALITSVDGDILINGTGGGSNTALSLNNYGVLISGGTVSSTGDATIAFNGIEGLSPALLTNEGFAMLGLDSKLTTNAGTGAVTVNADKIAITTIATDATLDLGTNGITFRPLTAARPVDLGGADTALSLGLTDAELDRVTAAGSITVGGTPAGPVTVTAPITPATNVSLSLVSGGNIVQSDGGTAPTTGTLTAAGTGTVTFTSSGGTVQPLPDGADVTADTVAFGSGTDLAIQISGTVADSEAVNGYRRLTVAGDVDLTGSDLVLSGTHDPVLGNVFLIVDNQGSNPITGGFNGLIEGAIIYGFLPLSPSPLVNARISYIGGDGNDVTLTVEPQEIVIEQPAPTGLTDGASTIDFGNLVPPAFNTLTFTIRNVGSQPLTLGSITTFGGNAGDFVVNQVGLVDPLAPNASTTFTVTFSPLASGSRNTVLQIPNNDGDENPFDINLTGIGLAYLIPGALDDVVTGGQAPDATGNNPIGEFDSPYRNGFIAENGFMTFTGSLKQTGGVTAANDSGIWKHDLTLPNGLKLLGREGDADPTATGTFDQFAEVPVPAINDAGEVTFYGKLLIGGLITTSNDTGIWSELGGSGLNLLLQEGDDVGGGKLVGNFTQSVYATAQLTATTGEAALPTTLTGASTNTAILRASVNGPAVTVSVVAEQNTASPLGPNFGALNGGYSDPRMDAQGNIAFAALLTGLGESIWYQPVAGGPPVSVFAFGNVAPDTTGGPTFIGFDRPSMGNNGVMCFRATLASTIGSDNADGKKNDGIWRGSVGGGFTCILRRGDDNTNRLGLGLPAGAKVGNPWGGWLTNGNRGAWRAWLDLDGDGVAATRSAPENDVHALFADTDGTMKMVVKEGDPVPGVAGATFDRFDLPVVGGTEQMAFIATITGPGIDGTNNKGVWRQAPNGGALALMARTGDDVVTSIIADPTKKITNVRFPGSLTPGETNSSTTKRRWEQPVMDSTGKLLIYVDFDDASKGELLAP